MRSLLRSVCLIVPFVAQAGVAQNPDRNDASLRLYLTQVAAAEAFLQLNHISTARNYLDACDTTYRGVEWRFLNAALDRSQRTMQRPDGNTVAAIQVSPDGKMLAAACSDSTIALSTYPGLEPVRTLKGHKAPVSTIAFSHDGTTLASGGRDHAVILWDVATGMPIGRNDQSFSQGIYQVSFSPDDSMLGVVSWERLAKKVPPVNGFVKILDAHDAHELMKMETDPHPAAGVAFSEDGKNLIAATWGEIAYSFAVPSGKLNWKYDLSDPAEYNAFHSMDLSPDGKTIALGSTDHRIHLLNSGNGALLRRVEPWQGHTKTIKAVRFSRDGKWLASAGEDQTILIWNTDGYQKGGTLVGHVKTVSGLAWSRGGNTLVSSSLDATVKQWDLLQGFERSYEICEFGPWQTPLSSDKRLFAAPCSDKNLAVYEVATGKPVMRFGAQSGLCADISHDGQWLVTSSFDGVVRLWDIPSGSEKAALKGHAGRVDGIAFMNSRQSVISVGDTTLRLWSLKSAREEKMVPLKGGPFRLVLHPDESRAYVGFGDGSIKIFETNTWSEVGSLACANGLQEMDMSPDGRFLAAFSGKNVEVWDLKTFDRKFLLSGHELAGYGICFSPDSRYLLSGSHDQTFRLWNLANGVCTLTYHGYEDMIYSCKFVSASEFLIGSAEGKIWYYRF